MIGIDSAEMLTEIEVSAPSDFDFGLEDVSSEESDTDDDYEMVKNSLTQNLLFSSGPVAELCIMSSVSSRMR